MRPRPLVSRPAFALACSLLGAGLYALYAVLRFPAGQLRGQFVYVVPIVVPFVAFLLDRASRLRQSAPPLFVIDALVVGVSVWRAVGHVPYVSGHALFLSYALLGCRSAVARVAAAAVLLEVVYLKYFVWHDWLTPTTGIVAGSVAAFLARRYGSRATAGPMSHGAAA